MQEGGLLRKGATTTFKVVGLYKSTSQIYIWMMHDQRSAAAAGQVAVVLACPAGKPEHARLSFPLTERA